MLADCLYDFTEDGEGCLSITQGMVSTHFYHMLPEVVGYNTRHVLNILFLVAVDCNGRRYG